MSPIDASGTLRSEGGRASTSHQIRPSSWRYVFGSPGYVPKFITQETTLSRVSIPRAISPLAASSQTPTSMTDNTGSSNLPNHDAPPRRAKTASEVTKRTWSNDPREREGGWQFVYLTGYTQSGTRPYTYNRGRNEQQKGSRTPSERPPDWPRIAGAWIDGPQYGGSYSRPFLHTQSVGAALEAPMWGWEASEVEKVMTERRKSAAHNPKLRPARIKQKKRLEDGDDINRYRMAMLSRYDFTVGQDHCQRHQDHTDASTALMQAPPGPHKCTAMCKRSCSKRPPLPAIRARGGPSRMVRNRADQLGANSTSKSWLDGNTRGTQTAAPASLDPSASIDPTQAMRPKRATKAKPSPNGRQNGEDDSQAAGLEQEPSASTLQAELTFANFGGQDAPPADPSGPSDAPPMPADGADEPAAADPTADEDAASPGVAADDAGDGGGAPEEKGAPSDAEEDLSAAASAGVEAADAN